MTVGLSKWFGKKGGIGIEITAEQVTIAQIEKRGNRLRLKHLVSGPIPADAVVDGRVEDPQAVATIIQDLVVSNGLKGLPVATAIPSREAVIRLIRLPADLQADELREVVLNQEAELYLPFPREEAYVDYQALESGMDPDGVKRQEILLVAAQHSVVDSYTQAIRLANLSVRTVDIASFALIRALHSQLLQYSSTEAVALVLLQAEGTEISILLKGVPQFSRTINLGLREFREVLGRTLDLPPGQAASLLQSLAPTWSGSDDESSSTSRGATALRRLLSELAEEVQRSLDFYLSQGDVAPVSRVLLAGSGANINQLDQFLSQRLALPVNQVNPLAVLSLPEDSVPAESRAGVGIVLGLGLRSL